MDKTAVATLTGWGVSLIGLALAYKHFNTPEWINYLGAGSFVLLMIGTLLFGEVFDMGFAYAFVVSAFFVGCIILFFELYLGLIFLGLAILVLLFKVGGES